MAPDGRMTQAQLDKIGYKFWKRCEAVGFKQIEKLSLLLSRQAFEQKKKMKVEQHLREKFALDMLKSRARIRVAQQYSPDDTELNKRILKRAEHSENMLYQVIASEFDPTVRTTALAIEVKEQSTSPLAHVGQKKVGLG